MKKIFTLLMGLLAFTYASATDYTGTLDVYLGTSTTPSTTENQVVSVTDNGSGNYTLAITNFKFGEMKVGDVTLSKVKGETQSDGSIKLTDEGETFKYMYVIDLNITITDATLSADGKTLRINGLTITNVPAFSTVSVKFYMPVTKTYDGYIGVTVLGQTSEQAGSVIVTDKGNGDYTMAIKNFSFGSIVQNVDITLSNVKGEEQTDGSVKLTDEETITVSVIPNCQINMTDATISADGETLTIKGLAINALSQEVAVTFSKYPAALSEINAQDNTSYEIYTLTGRKIQSLSRGVNIIRYANGQTKKVLVK